MARIPVIPANAITAVIPAQAGIQPSCSPWTPASAGVTTLEVA